jgi:hypothetical protein
MKISRTEELKNLKMEEIGFKFTHTHTHTNCAWIEMTKL